MKTTFKNLNEVFKHAKCVFCDNQLSINVDAITGYFRKDKKDLFSIDEVDGRLLFIVDMNNNKTEFSNAEIKDRLEVFVLELECSKHNYRHIYSLYFNKSKNNVKVNKILLDEESVLITGEEKTYWVRNLFAENEKPFSEISSWDPLDGAPPKSHFDIDALYDLFATFKLETEWLEINPKIGKRIENIITFG